MKKKNLIADIKNKVKKSGSSKGKVLYLKDGSKVRIRFLQELDDGIGVLFHDNFDLGINHPCQELYDRECEHHEEDDKKWRHRELFAWTVYDYEAKEAKILLGAANNFSPIPQLVGMFDTYGTMTDRDYVITKTGSGMQQSFSVVPMDKVTFKNKTAKAYSETKILQLLDKAFPADDVEEDEDDEEETPKKKSSKKPAAKKKPAYDEDDDEDEEDDEEEEEKAPKCFGSQFGELKACKKCSFKKTCEAASDDEEDEEDEDDDDESKYSGMTPKKLFDECNKRGIKVKMKMPADYYIAKLEADDEEDDDEDEAW